MSHSTSLPADLWDIQVTSLQGVDDKLSRYRDSVLLIVNTASACGFTPHYAGLEALYREFASRGLVVLGFPCNQFGHQEPGSAKDIESFCRTNYDLTFPMHAKIEVNGADEHPLYAWLKAKAPGLLGTTAIKWNFTKFLVDRSGTQVMRFAPNEQPAALREPILTWLAARAGDKL